jgi:hypothetical protein
MDEGFQRLSFEYFENGNQRGNSLVITEDGLVDVKTETDSFIINSRAQLARDPHYFDRFN